MSCCFGSDPSVYALQACEKIHAERDERKAQRLTQQKKMLSIFFYHLCFVSSMPDGGTLKEFHPPSFCLRRVLAPSLHGSCSSGQASMRLFDRPHLPQPPPVTRTLLVPGKQRPTNPRCPMTIRHANCNSNCTGGKGTTCISIQFYVTPEPDNDDSLDLGRLSQLFTPTEQEGLTTE